MMKFNDDQINSLVRSVLKIISGVFAAKGLTDVSTLVSSQSVEELVASALLGFIATYASHKSNATPPVNSVTVTSAPATPTAPATETIKKTVAAPVAEPPISLPVQ